MHYFIVATVAAGKPTEYCFTDKNPDGIATRAYRLSDGVSLAADYPPNPADVQLQLGDAYPGLKLPSFLGNCGRMFIVDNSTSDIILAHQVGKVEKLGFVLLDHKGRIYSRDYCFLNSLERIHCMDEQKSTALRTSKGTIMRITKLVLDAGKVQPALDFFRLGEQPSVYLVSERLMQALCDRGCTNFVFNEVALA